MAPHRRRRAVLDGRAALGVAGAAIYTDIERPVRAMGRYVE